MINMKKLTNKKDALENIKNSIIGCYSCDLCFERNKIVFGEGNENAEIMFVGEGPGAEENNSGRPFVGRCGKLLDKLLGTINLVRKDVYIANIIKCRPPNNRNPKSDEIKSCIPYLHQQLDIINPKIIVLLGTVALKSLFNNDNLGIMKNRGKWLLYKEIPVMPTYHPSFLLRQMSEKNKKAVKDDFQMIVEKIKKSRKVKVL